MNYLNKSLVSGSDLFLDFNPTWPKLFKLKWLKKLLKLRPLVRSIYDYSSKRKDFSDCFSSYLGNITYHKYITNNIYNINKSCYSMSNNHIIYNNYLGLGANYRTWITDNERINNRIIKKARIMYHDANKAGKHLDIHIGYLSFIYRISGKPVEKELKFINNKLTKNSKNLLINHVKQEISKHARVPQNHDHTLSNANSNWLIPTKIGYGSGKTRQEVLSEDIEIYKTSNNTIHMYFPGLSETGIYLYKLYDKSTPICIMGIENPKNINFEDRLHLKLLDLNTFKSKIDPKTQMEKIDGASTYLYSKDGIRLYSPRIGVSGNRIEYTYKIPEICLENWKNKPTFTGMGELSFYKKGIISNLFGCNIFNRLTAAECGGILNSNKVRPKNIIPQIHLYRIDKFDNNNVIHLPFFNNRKLQKIISHNSNIIKVVPRRSILLSKLLKMEGVVATGYNQSILDGYKYKNKGDEIDMIITSIDLYKTKDRIAGTITCEYENKEYKFGPSQIGTFQKCNEFMNNNYIGRTVKTQGFNGHIGRASKIISIHTDK